MGAKSIRDYPKIVQESTVEILLFYVDRFEMFENKQAKKIDYRKFINDYMPNCDINYRYSHIDKNRYYSRLNPEESLKKFEKILRKYDFFAPFTELYINVIGPYACSMSINNEIILRAFDEIFHRTQELCLPLFMDSVNSMYESFLNGGISLYRSLIVYTSEGIIPSEIIPDNIKVKNFEDVYDFNDKLFKIFSNNEELKSLFNINVKFLKRIEICEKIEFKDLETNENKVDFDSEEINKLSKKYKKIYSFYRTLILTGAKIKAINNLAHFNIKFLNFTIFPTEFTNIGTFSANAKKQENEKFNKEDIARIYELFYKADEKVLNSILIPLERYQKYLLSNIYADKAIEMRVCIDSLLDINLSSNGYTRHAVFRINYLLPHHSKKKIKDTYRKLSCSIHSNDIDEEESSKSEFLIYIGNLMREIFLKILENNEFYSHEKWIELYNAGKVRK